MCLMGGVPIGAYLDPPRMNFSKHLQELNSHLERGPT